MRWIHSIFLTISIVFLISVIPEFVCAQNPYTSSYQYLTIFETSVFGEVIKFWHVDTLRGPVHSNDTIEIMETPVFFDTVSTSADGFWQGIGYCPQFYVNPIFNAPRVALPDSANEIREAAAAAGLFFDSNSGQLASRLVFNNEAGWILYQWPMGTHFDSTAIAMGPPRDGEAFFIEGYLELKGIFRGRATVGAQGHPNPDEYLGYHCIKLLDDIRYWFADDHNGSFNDTTGGYTDMLGIVSESNISIANTWENGRENGYNVAPWNWNRHSIVITAAMIALGESFSFEDQNEDPATATPWEFWTGNYNCPYPPAGPYTDERGNIYLKGSITQNRRGYTHRSNHSGTGYGKSYDFDQRFRFLSPLLGIRARHIPVLDPDELHFGNVSVGQTDTLYTTLTNDGGTYIDIEEITINEPSYVFSVIATEDITALKPGNSLTFQVMFEPQAAIEYRDTLTIALYYGDDLKIPLSGNGTALSVGNNNNLPDELDISVFPNPFNNQLQITWNADDLPVNVTLYNIHGKQIKSVALHADHPYRNFYTWQPVNLAGGIYFIKLTTQQNVRCKKVVFLK